MRSIAGRTCVCFSVTWFEWRQENVYHWMRDASLLTSDRMTAQATFCWGTRI